MSPRFSIVTPVYKPPAWVLRETIDSVLAQTYGDWEWCLVDDASGDPTTAAILAEAAAGDHRIRVATRTENGGIIGATNDALAMAGGEFVAFLDHDDLLHPDALSCVAEAIDAAPEDDVDYVYTDEDKVDEQGERYNPFFKPDWSPERMRCQMYTCHFGVVRRRILDEVGGLRHGFEGSQDFDLILRVTERARRVVHVPRVLYSWRAIATSAASSGEAKPYAFLAGQRAIAEHLLRVGFPADVLHDDSRPGQYHLVPRLREEPLVSIVIPTRGGRRVVHGLDTDLVVNTVRSVVQRSTYQRFEIVVVVDPPTPADTIDALQALGGARLRLVPYHRPFNFSEKINVGVAHAAGDHLLLLNDDVEVIAPDWIEHLLMYAVDPAVGAVGGKLRFADRRLQHIGIVCTNGVPHHPFYGYPADFGGHFGSANLPANYLAVTGACLLVRRQPFEEVGGFSTVFPYNFNDVDFGLKLHRRGYRNVYSPGAELYHYESSTRPAVVEQDEIDRLQSRWGAIMHADPYFNPAFLHQSPNYLVPAVLSGYLFER